MPQLSPSRPYPIGSDSPGPQRAEPLPGGLGVDLYAFPVGCVAVKPSPRHLVSLHVGPPIRASCRCDGQQYERMQQEGDIDFVPAGIPGYWEDLEPAKALVVRLPADLVRRTARSMGIPTGRIGFEARFQMRDPQIEHIGWAMKAEIEAGRPGGRVTMESLATALSGRLVQLFARDEAAPVRLTQLTGRRRRQVLDYIEARLDEDLSLARLAAVAGMSESHFKALFRNTLGQPVHQYVMARRVERARLLIEEGDLPIAQVALEAGFAHQSHLARWMRRLLGVTPAALPRRRR